MKSFILIICFVVFSSFMKSSNPINENKDYYIVNDDEVTYCVASGGNLYCCQAATYGEARDCANLMALVPTP